MIGLLTLLDVPQARLVYRYVQIEVPLTTRAFQVDFEQRTPLLDEACHVTCLCSRISAKLERLRVQNKVDPLVSIRRDESMLITEELG